MPPFGGTQDTSRQPQFAKTQPREAWHYKLIRQPLYFARIYVNFLQGFVFTPELESAVLPGFNQALTYPEAWANLKRRD